MNKVLKKRYALPAKIIELMWTDDTFYNDVIKIKRHAFSTNFPKQDQWCDEQGFHLSFALAGYSVDDIKIYATGSILMIKSDGIDEDATSVSSPPAAPQSTDDAYEEYARDAKAKIHQGLISRGIARRKFDIGIVISEEFDLLKTFSTMSNGLLKITIPAKAEEDKTISIVINKE